MDFRNLNACTVKDAYPLPRIDDSITNLEDARYFTLLDICRAFWQVMMREGDKQKTAFSTPRGLFQRTRMPFGLCNATATFQKLMDWVFSDIKQEFGNMVIYYVDDVLIATKTIEQHVTRLNQALRQAGLKCKPEKCDLLKQSVKYLGRVVDAEGMKPDPEAVEPVISWRPPRNLKEMQSFLGFANYFRDFIQDFSAKAYPLKQLTRRSVEYKWSDECQQSFDELKRLLTSEPVLKLPDSSGRFILDTDASAVAIAAVISQQQEEDGEIKDHPIAYGSKSLSDTEKCYGAPKAEMLAAVYFIEKFEASLCRAEFTLRRDNSALSWLKKYCSKQCCKCSSVPRVLHCFT